MPKATKIGVVTSNKMHKTAVVSVERLVRHPLYKRSFKKTSTFMVHDEENRLQVGDKVRIVECRPLSKHKRWRLVEVLESQPKLDAATPAASAPTTATASAAEASAE